MSKKEQNFETDDQINSEIVSACPEGIPEMFWDNDKGELMTDVLLQSYSEMQERLDQSLPLPNDEDPETYERILTALGRPESPDGYDFGDDLVGIVPDPELNEALHAAGFSQSQAKMVYKLASDRLQPMIEDMQKQIATVEHRVRLEQHFGGADRYKQVAADLQRWGEARLGPEALDALASTYEGVLALHQMVQSSEPEMVGNTGEGPTALNQEQLNEMMADPRYWRDHDPAFIARVTEGYSKLYSD